MAQSDVKKKRIRDRLGIPDWQNPESYPSPDELTLKGWRWEFLRRNEEYRKDFRKPERYFKEASKNRHFENKYLLVDIVNPRLSVRAINEQEVTPDDPFPPNFNSDVQFVDHEDRYLYSTMIEVKERLLTNATMSHLFLRVELRRPLRPQFKRLLAIAQSAQRSWRTKDRRPRMDLWPVYLRALDARAVGESYSTIARSLLTHTGRTPQNARDVVKQAEALGRNWPF